MQPQTLKPYLLIFNTTDGQRQDILDYLDTRREVKNWYAFLPAAVIIISDAYATELSNMFLEKFPNRFHLITEVSSNKNGWLSKETWDFMNNPKSLGRWP